MGGGTRYTEGVEERQGPFQGQAIKGNFRGRGRWYAGEIARRFCARASRYYVSSQVAETAANMVAVKVCR